MLFKLSIRNMKKSFKDYAIYFLTLVLGVAIFYMFNSIDSQQAMLEVSESTRSIIKLMISLLGYVSVFVAVVLGLLIVYANNFLTANDKEYHSGNLVEDKTKTYWAWEITSYSDTDPCTYVIIYVDSQTGEIVAGKVLLAMD